MNTSKKPTLHFCACAILALSAAACSKKAQTSAPDPAKAAGAEAQKLEAAPAPVPVTPTAAPVAATPVEAAPAEADPTKNGWNLPPRATTAKDGDRIYVLTQGKDRSYTNNSAVYHLFAHDLGEIKGDVMTVKELGGGTFKVTGLFIIPAGLAKPDEVKNGDMVLAEWASSLKHAQVTKVDGDKITVRYTDLPDNWGDDKLVAVKTQREVTKQKDGFSPGNFAVAIEEDQPVQVLLIAESGDKWLAKRFAGRVGVFATKDIKPIPIKPSLKTGQMVQVPWVGRMYKGKIKKINGTRVEVAVDGIATKEPVVTSLGQILPE